MEIPLLRGRFFTNQDNEHSPRVIVVDDVFARKYFPNENPIGKRILRDDASPEEIVGVVGHVKQWGLDADDTEKLRAQIYIPCMKAEAEASKRDQDLTVARTNLQLQESLMKNALTKTLDDPALEEMPVVPIDEMQADTEASEPILDLIDRALRNRPELQETDIDLVNRQISRKAARNALLPSLALVGFYGGTGLGGELNPVFEGENSSNVPSDLPGT